MLPYLNRSASLAQTGSGSSRKNLYQPNHPPNAPITTRAMIQPRMIFLVRGVKLIVPCGSRWSALSPTRFLGATIEQQVGDKAPHLPVKSRSVASFQVRIF